MTETLFNRSGVEMGMDPAMLARVKRLALVSSIALGGIFVLAVATVDAHPAIDGALAAGWVLMPSLLVASLRRRGYRYLLVVPSALVSLGLLGIVFTAPPDSSIATAGWLLTTVGVLLGGLLGIWFWFRLLPVPETLDDPFSPGRWTLIGTHVTLIVVGLVLVIAGSS